MKIPQQIMPVGAMNIARHQHPIIDTAFRKSSAIGVEMKMLLPTMYPVIFI